MELQLVVTGELIFQRFGETGIGIEPRDFVLILISEEFVVVARHCLGESGTALGSLALHVLHAPDKRRIALCIGGILIGDQIRSAPSDQLLEGLGTFYLDNACPMNASRLRGTLRPHRRSPTPEESLLVHLDRHAVQFDGALDGLRANGHQAPLIGEAEHEEIAPQAVAKQGRRKFRCVDELGALITDGGGDGVTQ